jgi:hypothetical protein
MCRRYRRVELHNDRCYSRNDLAPFSARAQLLCECMGLHWTGGINRQQVIAADFNRVAATIAR